jgi:hypothetical protein
MQKSKSDSIVGYQRIYRKFLINFQILATNHPQTKEQAFVDSQKLCLLTIDVQIESGKARTVVTCELSQRRP